MAGRGEGPPTLQAVQTGRLRPLDVQQETGAAKRAAAGYLLLGAGGAAAGVLMGKGQNVLFEFDCHDGVIRRGVVPQKYYPAMRRAVARIVRYRPGDTRRQLARCAVYLALAIGLTVAWGGGGFALGVLVGIGAEITLDRRRLAQPG